MSTQCPGAAITFTACRSALALYIRGWLSIIEPQVRTQVDVAINVTKGSASGCSQIPHESSETIARDRSTSTHPEGPEHGASDNTEFRKVWKTPSRNPLMADQQLNPNKCGRNHIVGIVLAVHGRRVPIMWTPQCTRSPLWDQKVRWFFDYAMVDGPKTPTPAWTTAEPAPSRHASTASTSTAYKETTRNSRTKNLLPVIV